MADKINVCIYWLKMMNYQKRNNTIWDKVSGELKKEFDSKPVHNKHFLKTNIKSHGNKVTDFCDKEIPTVGSNHTCSN